jgi:hypothetical protein
LNTTAYDAAGVVPASGNTFSNASQSRHVDRYLAAASGVVAKLAAAVQTPTLNSAVSYCAGEVLASRDRVLNRQNDWWNA